ncbi:DUF5119 domain-containing protein [uncultured Duncaniella sp.]|uniref:DUF5119 domain-containing protein n=2 Tax=uncultured Duncaniella sp. TaxID=2768039 RepID=UPI0025D343CC|nr:DUF5119 domain-containing protein [uncultured Duncaniella sp.]
MRIHCKNAIRALLLGMILCSVASSCRKDLCYNHFRAASVSLDWEYAWERDYGMHYADIWDEDLHGFSYNSLLPGRPEGVTLLVYGDEDSPSVSFMGAEGADVSMYGDESRSFLFYNNDTEYIVISDVGKLPSARASTTGRSRSSLTKITELHPDERTINPPDVLFASFVEEAPEVGVHQLKPLRVNMQPLVYTYIIRYEFEHGKEHVALARGALAGMAESVYLRDGVTSEESATLLYDCVMTDYGAMAKVRSFGIPGFPDEYYGRAPRTGNGHIYTLNLEVRLTNGNIKELTFDVTPQLERQPRGGVITVRGIRVEDSENQSDSGFDVTVEDWGEHEDIDLPVGSQQL